MHTQREQTPGSDVPVSTRRKSAREATGCVDGMHRRSSSVQTALPCPCRSLALRVPTVPQATDILRFSPIPLSHQSSRRRRSPAEGCWPQCRGGGEQVTGSPLRRALGLAAETFAASVIPRRGGGPGPSGRTKDVPCSRSRTGRGTGGGGRTRTQDGVEAGELARGEAGAGLGLARGRLPGAATNPRQVPGSESG